MNDANEDEGADPVERICGTGEGSAEGTICGLRSGRRPSALVLRPDGDMARIDVTDREGRILVGLGPFEEHEVVAIWRGLAKSSGLPLAIAGPDGQLGFPWPQIGPLQLGPALARRRMPILNGRRPRFLVRRKAARLSRRPLVYREPEIAAGRGG